MCHMRFLPIIILSFFLYHFPSPTPLPPLYFYHSHSVTFYCQSHSHYVTTLLWINRDFDMEITSCAFAHYFLMTFLQLLSWIYMHVMWLTIMDMLHMNLHIRHPQWHADSNAMKSNFYINLSIPFYTWCISCLTVFFILSSTQYCDLHNNNKKCIQTYPFPPWTVENLMCHLYESWNRMENRGRKWCIFNLISTHKKREIWWKMLKHTNMQHTVTTRDF